MDFLTLLDRLANLAFVVPELGPYRSIVSSLYRQWASHDLEAGAGRPRGSCWPKPEDYGFLLGWHDADAAAGPSLRCVSQSSGVGRQRRSRCDPATAGGDMPAGLRPGSAAAYVASVVLRGEVLTRPCSIHDFANALSWTLFPRLKWEIYRLLWQEYEAFLRDGPSPSSGRGRSVRSDRLTWLDEAGVLGWRGHRVLLGHALLEHLLLAQPRQVNAPLWLLHPRGACPDPLPEGLSASTKPNVRAERPLDRLGAVGPPGPPTAGALPAIEAAMMARLGSGGLRDGVSGTYPVFYPRDLSLPS